MSIELRLTSVDPPEPEPKRTIYRDIVNLPDPVKLGITIRYFNHDDVDLYFQITGSGTGYTFGTVNLGLRASGTDAYKNLDEFASRAKPSPSDLPNGEMEENITLILRAYTDADYAPEHLKWTFERVVTVHWINSADATWTVDVLNNFDDGTVQDWSQVLEVGAEGGSSIGVATAYVLSPPYSLYATFYDEQYRAVGSFPVKGYIKKDFTTPNKTKVFAVFDLRFSGTLQSGSVGSYSMIQAQIEGDTILINIQSNPPKEKWIRMVVPLPSNASITLKARGYGNWSVSSGYNQHERRIHIYLDDFKIISK